VQWRCLDGLVENRVSSEVCWRTVVRIADCEETGQDILDVLNVYFDFVFVCGLSVYLSIVYFGCQWCTSL